MSILKKIIGLPKTLYFNMYYFPFLKALKLPVIVAPDVKLLNMGSKDGLELNFKKRVYLGYGESFALGGETCWSLVGDGKICFKGSAIIGKGTQIICVGGGITFGDNFYCNANCIINAGKSLIFGDSVLMGWNCTVLDGDGHNLIDKNGVIKRFDPISIGNHVWCAADTKILKGSLISDDSVVAAGACISKKFQKSRLLLGGYNKILRENIDWSVTFNE